MGSAPGGSGDIQFRGWGQEQPTIKKGYGFQENQYNQFRNNDPLLGPATSGALGFFKSLGSLTGPLMSALQGPGGIAETIANRGALSAQGKTAADQAAYATFGRQGNLGGNAAALGSVLNREAASQSRFNTALSQAQGVGSSVQGLQTGGLNQLLGVGNAAVSQFSSLTNPILSYLSNLFQGNQQASISKAQLHDMESIAGSDQTMKWVDLGLSAVGKIIGGVAMSDERMKQKIRDTGLKTREGVPLKTFEYKTRPGVRMLGVMAQDAEKKVPEAVVTEPHSGVKFIDTSRFPIIRLLQSGGC